MACDEYVAEVPEWPLDIARNTLGAKTMQLFPGLSCFQPSHQAHGRAFTSKRPQDAGFRPHSPIFLLAKRVLKHILRCTPQRRSKCAPVPAVCSHCFLPLFS